MAERRPIVLVVDDDAATRMLIAEVLSAELGATVRGAGDGHEAIAAIGTAPPDLILLDLKMPGLDGPAVLHWLKSSPRTDGIPVLAVTGWANAITLQALERRCDGLIGKPFDLDDLVAAVRRLLAARTRPVLEVVARAS
jgi:twitching motility two-component system response regulator PilH